MKTFTTQELLDKGYEIENAEITDVDLSMADHGQLVLQLVLEGSGWGSTFGNFTIGFGELDAKEFKGCEQGIELLMQTMDAVGVARFQDMKGKIVRVATESRTTRGIGNAIYDKWCIPMLMWDT